MSPRLPRITGTDLLRVLQRAGWLVARQRGSHVQLEHPHYPGRRITIPVHAGEILPPKTLSSALDQAGLTADDLRKLL